MCHFKIIKYTGCGCEIKVVMARCAQGDGAGNCGSAYSRYERAVMGGVCGRGNCSYYEFPRPRRRWDSDARASSASSSRSAAGRQRLRSYTPHSQSRNEVTEVYMPGQRSNGHYPVLPEDQPSFPPTYNGML